MLSDPSSLTGLHRRTSHPSADPSEWRTIQNPLTEDPSGVHIDSCSAEQLPVCAGTLEASPTYPEMANASGWGCSPDGCPPRLACPSLRGGDHQDLEWAMSGKVPPQRLDAGHRGWMLTTGLDADHRDLCPPTVPRSVRSRRLHLLYPQR